MAQFSIVKKASMIAVVAVALTAATTVSAQGPAPSPDAGAAFSVPASEIVYVTKYIRYHDADGLIFAFCSRDTGY
ncbi:hypothetical protein OSB04_023484 [Centaurea solstitialis]|uniref:Uncharacterized protein n=1 Tax=Centaurea solstitialis TaxID=347529 RepID=A0AA38T2S8_9ASTR|nr:hypothetical protein OSB04_023484 [Centaurea solstitialis]